MKLKAEDYYDIPSPVAQEISKAMRGLMNVIASEEAQRHGNKGMTLKQSRIIYTSAKTVLEKVESAI